MKTCNHTGTACRDCKHCLNPSMDSDALCVIKDVKWVWSEMLGCQMLRTLERTATFFLLLAAISRIQAAGQGVTPDCRLC